MAGKREFLKRNKIENLKSRIGEIKHSILLLSIILYFFILFLYFVFGDKGYLRIKEINFMKRELITNIENLRRENDELKKQINVARSDPFWIEKVAREELDMMRDGEKTYKFIRSKK